MGEAMEELKDLLWRKQLEISREESQQWFVNYGIDYYHALEAVTTTLDLAEKLRSKKRGIKSKNNIARKIQKINDAAMAPGRGRRSLPKRDPTTGRKAMPADPGVVKYEYENRLRQLQDIHRDVRELRRKGVRTNREIYRQLSSNLYYKYELPPATLEMISEAVVKDNTELMNQIRGVYPLSTIPFERFEYLMSITPREGAIEITADYFLIKPKTVEKKLGS